MARTFSLAIVGTRRVAGRRRRREKPLRGNAIPEVRYIAIVGNRSKIPESWDASIRATGYDGTINKQPVRSE
jgi:hypothetical protein